MGLLGEIGKALQSTFEDNLCDKWKIFPFCSGTTGTKDVIKLLSKWDEIFQKDNFFQDMEMFPIDRRATVYADESCDYFIPDPNNSTEFKEMPGPQNVFHPRDGWVCKLKNGGTIFIAIKDWVDYYHSTKTRAYEYFIRDNFDGIYEQFDGSYLYLCNGFHNIGRYKNEFALHIFRTYYLYYKPNQNDDKYLTFLVTTRDCCEYKDVIAGDRFTAYLHSDYERFITKLKIEGWYDPPASMYVGYSDGSSSMYGYLTALKCDSKYLATTETHEDKLYGVTSCNEFFELLSKEEWIQEIDVEVLYQHLVEFTQPICQEIERVNTLDIQKFQDAKKRKQEEKEADQQRKEDEARRLEEEKREKKQREEDSLKNSLDSI